MKINKLTRKQASDKSDKSDNPDSSSGLKYYRSGSSKNSENMATWNVEDSFIRDEHSPNDQQRRTLVKSPTSNLINTPKMLELDVNRMIISQNQAS